MCSEFWICVGNIEKWLNRKKGSSCSQKDCIKSLSYGMTSFMIRINPNPLPTGARFGFIRCGGGEENRTPVRKFIHIGISECSLSFPFPYPVADKQAKGLGILLYIVHAGGTLRRRSPLIDARIRIRGPIRPDGCLIKQQMQRYCCRLILSVRFLRGPAPLLASHASKSPSRPLRPQIFDAISFLFCFLIV